MPFFLALLLVQTLAEPSDDAQRLASAALLLGNGNEKTFRQGSTLCREMDTPASAEMLLDVLNETNPTRGMSAAHFRDVVWEDLVQFQNLDAQLCVAEELRENKGNAWCRAWCAELIGYYVEPRYAHALFVESLMKGLGDKEIQVRRAAAHALGMAEVPLAVPMLLEASKDKDPYLRGNAIGALGRIDRWKHRTLFLDAVSKDKDGGVRCALLGMLPDLYPKETEGYSVTRLSDSDWRPRLQAVENLEKIRTGYTISSLIAATLDERVVVSLRAMQALSALTGLKHSRGESWKAWWEKEQGSFTFPDDVDGEEVVDLGGSRAEYHGIRIQSDHVVFLMDRSHPMRASRGADSSTKLAASEAELGRALGQLGEDVLFDVFCYRDDFTRFERKQVRATKKSAEKALRFVSEQSVGAKKDVWQVLEAAVTDPEIDTVFLLSSGEPDDGRYVHADRISRQLRELNRFHKTVVNTIAFADNPWYLEQLETIATATKGKFRAVP